MVHSDAATVNPRDVLIDDSKQADIENLGDCHRVLGDGQTLGDFSLTIIPLLRKIKELWTESYPTWFGSSRAPMAIRNVTLLHRSSASPHYTSLRRYTNPFYLGHGSMHEQGINQEEAAAKN